MHGSAIPDVLSIYNMDMVYGGGSLYCSSHTHKSLGQFYDLLELFRVGGDIEETNYIFMVSCIWMWGIYGLDLLPGQQ